MSEAKDAREKAIETGPATAADQGVTATPEEVEEIKGDQVAIDRTDSDSEKKSEKKETKKPKSASKKSAKDDEADEADEDEAEEVDPTEGLSRAEKKEVARLEALTPVGGPLPNVVEPDKDVLYVHNISPVGGPAGTVIRVSGTGFDEVDSVKVGGKKAEFSVEGDTVLVATVPDKAESGTVEVSAGKDTELAQFAVSNDIIW